MDKGETGVERRRKGAMVREMGGGRRMDVQEENGSQNGRRNWSREERNWGFKA